MATSKFWMVLGSRAPTYRHTTKRAACIEAERLASLNPGEEFTVLESMATVVKTDVRWFVLEDVDQQDDSDVPF